MTTSRLIGRLFVAVLMLCVLAGPLAVDAHARLGDDEGRNLVRAAIRDAFSGAWQHGYHRSLRCSRMSRRALRCNYEWFVGDAYYSGRARARKVRGVRTAVGFVRMVDELCLYVTRVGQCVRVERVRVRRL